MIVRWFDNDETSFYVTAGYNCMEDTWLLTNPLSYVSFAEIYGDGNDTGQCWHLVN